MVYLLIALLGLLIIAYTLQWKAAQRSFLCAAYTIALTFGPITTGTASATQNGSQNSDVRVLELTEQGVSIRLIGDSHYQVGFAGEDGAYSRELPLSGEIKLRSRTFDPIKSTPDAQLPLRLMSAQEDMNEENVFIVQCIIQPLESFQREITALGGTIHTVLAENALLVRLSPDARQLVEQLPFVRWIGPYHPAYKLEDELYQFLARGDAGEAAQTSGRPQRYSILLFERSDAALAAVTERISQLGGVLDMVGDSRRMEATLDEATLEEITHMPEVLYVEKWAPYEDDMDQVREVEGVNYLETVEGYTGEGVRGEVSDDGVRLSHVDFQASPPLIHGRNNSDNDHGTNTYGIVFADGTGNSQGRGILPNAEPIFSSRHHMNNRARHTAELVDPTGPYRAVFQSNSWGSSRTTNYTSVSAEMDEILFENDILVTQSQSNAGNRDSRPQAWAKNIVAVGGIRGYNTERRSDDRWSRGASIGPAADGRIKPDLSNFYGNIFTTNENGNRAYTPSFGGTSGATPITAGQFGLVFQMWADGVFSEVAPGLDVFDARPHMTTAKALVINTAYQYEFSGTNHDRTRTHQGWGFPDMKNIYEMAKNNGWSVPILVNETKVLAPLGTHSETLEMAGGTPLKATLVYADPAGLPSAAQARINDLSLRVTSPSGTIYWGNNGLLADNWSTPGGNPNRIDTVENVFVENAEAGVWTVDILGSEIVQDSHPETPAIDADYALVVTRGLQPPPSGTPTTQVSIAATDPSATEAGPTNGVFTLTRTGQTLSPLRVQYQIAGTATQGSDYTSLGAPSIEIAAGQSSATINIIPIDDADIETDETVALTLSGGDGYTVGTPATATVTIVSDDTAPPPPSDLDLVVSDLSATPLTMVLGGQIDVSVTTANQGTDRAENSFTRLVLSTDTVIDDTDKKIGYAQVGALAAGTDRLQVRNIAIPTDIAAGTYYLGAIADRSGRVTETDESNNTRLGPALTLVQQVSGVDLVVSALTGTPQTVAAGDTVSVSVTTTNRGTLASVGFWTRLVLSTDRTIEATDTKIGATNVGVLNPVASRTQTKNLPVPASLSPGVYYLGGIADRSGRQVEADEGNNTLLGTTVTVTAPAAASTTSSNTRIAQ